MVQYIDDTQDDTTTANNTEELTADTIQFPLSIDSTMLSAFDSCPHKFFVEFILKRAPTGKSPHLHAGGALAAAVETVRNCIYTDGLSLEQSLAKAWLVYTKYWGMYEPPEDIDKTYINMFAAVIEYFYHWNPLEDTIQPHIKPDGKPAVEFTFGLPVNVNNPDTGDPILYSGRYDMLGEYHPSRLLSIVDDKTTKNFSYLWSRQWDMRGQFHGYIRASQEYGYNCEHYTVRGIAIQKTQFKFQEHGPIRIPKWKLNEWYENAIWKIKLMVHMYSAMKDAMIKAEGKGIDPMSVAHTAWAKSFGDACSSYAGCQYKSLCMEQNQHKYYSEMQERLWDPMAKNPTEKSKMRFEDQEDVQAPDELMALLKKGN